MDLYIDGVIRPANIVPMGETNVPDSIHSRNGRIEIYYGGDWVKSATKLPNGRVK